MSGARLADAEMWSAYWDRIGWPRDRKTALASWKNPGVLPEGPSSVLFRTFAPAAVQTLIQECGRPAAWLDATLLRYFDI